MSKLRIKKIDKSGFRKGMYFYRMGKVVVLAKNKKEAKRLIAKGGW